MAKRKDITIWLATALAFALGFAVFYTIALHESSDISIHATWASEGSFTNPKTFFYHGAHPLWHVLVALVLRTGLPLVVSAALVTALCKAAEVWLLIALAARFVGGRGLVATLCGLAASLVSAVWTPVFNPNVYLGAGSPNPWHSPTQLIAMVFMLLIVPYTADRVDGFQRRLPQEGARANVPWREIWVLAALLFVSLFAKPTFLQAFMPAACLYFGVMWLQKPKNTPFFLRMLAAAAPAILLMVLQYMFYFGIIVPSQGNMILAVSWGKAGEVAVSVLLTRLFPLFVLLTCVDRDTFQTPLMRLTLLMDAVAILEMLLLSENGRRASDGNFGWAMMGSALMLWAVTLPLYARGLGRWLRRRRAAAEGKPYLSNHPRLEPFKWATGMLLLLCHLASGIYYVVYLLNGASWL